MKNNSTNFIYRQVDSSRIFSDPAYQRPVDYKRVKLIADKFNPDLVNPIKVSERGGKYYVFDGQHTLAALKMRNGNENLPVDCKIYKGLSQADEAQLFSEQNGISRVVESSAKMKALYIAGDVEIIEMHDAINSAGIKFDFTKNKTDFKIIACSTIFRIFKKTTASEFQEILSLIRESWCGQQDSFNKEILGGMYLFCKTYKGRYDKNKAISQFRKISPQKIIREGKLFRDGGDFRFARQLVIAYNNKNRSKKLDELEVMK